MANSLSVKGTVPCSNAGDNIIFVCPDDYKIRLFFFGYSAGAGVTGVTVKLVMQGGNRDAQYLVAPGQPYARNMQGGTDNNYIDGNEGEDLVVNLSDAQLVHVNYELEIVHV